MRFDLRREAMKSNARRLPLRPHAGTGRYRWARRLGDTGPETAMPSERPTIPLLPAAARARVERLLGSGRRTLLGLAGPPGAGKSTLAEALLESYADGVQVVPMDGFHLANAELQRLGRAARKGAPDTFDSAGYVELLRRLRRQGEATTHGAAVVYAPAFRRDIEEPLAGAIPVFAHTRLIITEGNYLLCEDAGWAPVAALLDECWYLDGDEPLRRARLVRRHQDFGRSASQASDWVAHTDEPNARLIASTRHRAHWVFRWNES